MSPFMPKPPPTSGEITRSLISGILKTAPHRMPRRSEEHTSELQSRVDLVCRLLLEKKKKGKQQRRIDRPTDADHRAMPSPVTSAPSERIRIRSLQHRTTVRRPCNRCTTSREHQARH